MGNAPNIGSAVFSGDNKATVYYLPGFLGWDASFGDLQAVLLPFTYTTYNGAITITRYVDTNSVVTIPGSINGLTVRCIGSNAFYSCNALVGITIPSSVTNIGDCAFQNCASLKAVTIPDSVTSIGVSAFSGCSSVTNIAIGNGLTRIGSNGFYSCSSLTSITVETNNPAYSSVDGVLFNKNKTTLVQYPGNRNGDFTVPSSVTNIGNYAFQNCLNLRGLFFQSNAPVLGISVFLGVNDATIYYLPGTSGWGATLGGLPAMILPISYSIKDGSVTITVNSGASGVLFLPSMINDLPVRRIGDGTFQMCTNITSVTIPDNVISISDYAFCNCSKLTNFLFGLGVTNIGSYAFGSCSRLTNALIPSSVTSIGSGAFYGCTSLTNVTIPSSVINIGSTAFAYCNLTNVTIPGSVTSIGDGPFMGCSSLTSINVETNNPAYCSANGVLFNNDLTTLVQYPAGITGIYTILDSVTSIGRWAFYSCSSLANIAIPGSVTNIGSSAFSYCLSLTNVIIPSGVTRIGSFAFGGCVSLTNMTIPDSVTSIEGGTFYNCSSLTSMTIPSTATGLFCNIMTG